ncbi:hypothetical protein AO703_05295 [[Enterobacter] lignolyticus]|uniref:Uncharacterized protein n=1 Tax=[Enterobacter] lignolyticus TaxID=1334193 RepID=A0A806XAK5_9ENTR|nr:hypothetical protein AO703_05295 [[Enterobacter] lignolyticus]
MLTWNGESLQGNNKAISLFFYFGAGITPVRSNAKELIAAHIPVKADMFHIARTQKLAGFTIVTGD